MDALNTNANTNAETVAMATAAPVADDRLPGDGGYLRLFLVYRFALGAVLLLAHFGWQSGPLGRDLPDLFAVAAMSYFALALVGLLLHLRRVVDNDKLGQVAVLVDVLLITVMMHASGGVQSGLGMLVAVAIALGSLSLAGRTAMLFAALASLAVLAERLYAHLADPTGEPAYAQSGMLGAAFFALALLAQRLGHRATESERLAEQRGADLANLAQLNDYVIQQMRAGIVVVDVRGVIQVMNQAAWALLGMPVAMRHHPLAEASPTLAGQYRQWQLDPAAERPDFRATDGGPDLRASFAPIGDRSSRSTLIVLEDTARLTAEAQQLKLASLGRLTAGIAHEIRNPLGAISHAAQLLGESAELPSGDRRMAEIIHGNSQRVNEVVESILRLSRQGSPRPERLVLGSWLAAVAGEIRQAHGLGPGQFRVEVDPPATSVQADPGQLRQVIDVLCDNAVRHFDRARDELEIRLVGGATPESAGPFIELRDNGPGIARTAQANLFEPFFTTRHDGTGLGLYIARQLCEANRIRIEYLDQPTGGSGFRLSFASPMQATRL